jgi:hypothetical protein
MGVQGSGQSSVDTRLVGAGVLLLVAAGGLFLPTGVGVEVSAALVGLACVGIGVAAVRNVADG